MTINQLINDDNIIVNESYVKGYYSKRFCIYGIVWDGVFSDEEYINLFKSIIEFAASNKVYGVYSDVRMQAKVSPEARDYLKKELSPIGDKLIERVAVVVDGSPFKLFYLNVLTKFVGQRAKLFSNQQEALNYLVNINSYSNKSELR